MMAGDYDYDAISNMALESVGHTTIYLGSVTSSTLPNKDILYTYRASDGTATEILSPNGSLDSPSAINRFQQIILDLEE